MVKRLALVDTDLCIGCQCCMFACARRLGVGGFEKAAIMVRSAGGMERGFVVIVCRACLDPPCSKACPTRALTPQEGGGVRLEVDRCIGCQACLRSCIIKAIAWDEQTNKPIVCSHCGYCAEFCPYGVIKLEDRSFVGR